MLRRVKNYTGAGKVQPVKKHRANFSTHTSTALLKFATYACLSLVFDLFVSWSIFSSENLYDSDGWKRLYWQSRATKLLPRPGATARASFRLPSRQEPHQWYTCRIFIYQKIKIWHTFPRPETLFSFLLLFAAERRDELVSPDSKKFDIIIDIVDKLHEQGVPINIIEKLLCFDNVCITVFELLLRCLIWSLGKVKWISNICCDIDF